MTTQVEMNDVTLRMVTVLSEKLGRPVTAEEIHEFLFGDLEERLDAYPEKPKDDIWEPGRWWRVLDADGSIWLETSDEQEARNGLRERWSSTDEDEMVLGDPVPDRKLQRMYQTTVKTKWRDKE